MEWRDGRKERLYRRYDVEDVRGNLHFKQEVRVQNLSAGGMQVETDSHLAIGRRYTFRLQQEGQELLISGFVAWCKLSGTRRIDNEQVVPTYSAGISFESSLSPEGQALVGFLTTATLELHHRVFGRFRVLESTSADIGEQHDFLVERLSRGGMLISSDFLPPVESVFALEMELGDEKFVADGRVAYVRDLRGDDSQVEIGIEFQGVIDEQGRILEGFLASEFTEADSELLED